MNYYLDTLKCLISYWFVCSTSTSNVLRKCFYLACFENASSSTLQYLPAFSLRSKCPKTALKCFRISLKCFLCLRSVSSTFQSDAKCFKHIGHISHYFPAFTSRSKFSKTALKWVHISLKCVSCFLLLILAERCPKPFQTS